MNRLIDDEEFSLRVGIVSLRNDQIKMKIDPSVVGDL